MPIHPNAARIQLGVLVVLAIAGMALGWQGAQLPHGPPAAEHTRGQSAAASEQTAADLALYRSIVAEVRSGRDYYSAAREHLPKFGFPLSSPLNWRLPTYAWLFAALPATPIAQWLLMGLSVAGLALTIAAQSRTAPPLCVAISAILMFGVLRWCIDGEAYLAQEVWAAALIALSLAAHSLDGRWRGVAIASGIAALLFRELAAPYCGLALLLALGGRRWKEAAGWSAGIVAFAIYFAWHVMQVRAQQSAIAEATAGGLDLGQWLRLGGLDFVLLTTRMNSLLFAAPAVLLWLYLLASLLGLSRRTDGTSTLACLATLAYLLTFAFLGRPENFYWGLMPAPLLAWGGGQTLPALRGLLEAAGWPIAGRSAASSRVARQSP